MNAIGSFIYGALAITLLAALGFYQHDAFTIMSAVTVAALAWASAYCGALIDIGDVRSNGLGVVSVISMLLSLVIFVATLIAAL